MAVEAERAVYAALAKDVDRADAQVQSALARYARGEARPAHVVFAIDLAREFISSARRLLEGA